MTTADTAAETTDDTRDLLSGFAGQLEDAAVQHALHHMDEPLPADAAAAGARHVNELLTGVRHALKSTRETRDHLNEQIRNLVEEEDTLRQMAAVFRRREQSRLRAAASTGG